MTNRRKFIKQTFLASTSLALSGCRLGSAEKSGIDPLSINALRNKFNGSLITAQDEAFEMTRRVASWNPKMDKHPLLIARCKDADDVARSLEFAQEHSLVIATRSGGHSFLGWGTCDDGIVIDLSLMKEISVNPSNKTAKIGAGVLAQDLVTGAAPHGLVPVLGECGIVGVTGLTLGGGLGWLTGKYGASCDNLISASIVTHDSKILTSNNEVNSQLFWGLRGGGGNFGVVTNLEYQLHPLVDVYAGGFSYPLQDAASVLKLFSEFMASAPDEMQGLAYLYRIAKGEVHIIMVYDGETKEGEQLLKPFSSRSTLLSNTMQRRPYTETFTMPPYGEFAPTSFGYTKGTYIKQLSEEAIALAIEQFTIAPPFCAIGFDHYMHGEVCRIDPNSTAFNLRDPGGVHTWVGSAWNNVTDSETTMQWADESWNKFQKFTGDRIYSNYASWEGDGLDKMVYGSNNSNMSKLKKEYDPNNIFRLNCNVKPEIG